MDKKPNAIQRLLRVEPGISLGQWVYDLVANNWTQMVAIFVAGGGMTYLSAVTEWTAALGPAGVGAIGLLSALIAYIAISYAQLLRAKRRAQDTEARAIDHWQHQTDAINPLDDTFHRKRINLADLAHPTKRKIIGKKFTDCQLVGPANLFIFHNTTFFNVGFIDCDIVLTKQDAVLSNVTGLENSSFIGEK